MPRQRTILIIPPHGARARTLRVHGAVVVVLVLTIMAGFAAYFIPFSRFSLDKSKLNEKRNLERINEDLLYRIVGTRTILKEVQGQVHELDTRRRNVLLTSAEAAGRPEHVRKTADMRVALLDIHDIAALIPGYEQAWNTFVALIDSQPSFFEDVPVLVPIHGGCVLSVPFGRRVDPFTGSEKWHTGVDLVAPRGTPVIASARGNVAAVEDDSKWGKIVRLRHAEGLMTVYAHLGSIEVKRGQKVSRGQTIGTIGASGVTTGPHLHYEIHRAEMAVDPERFFYPAADSQLVRMAAISMR